MACATSVVKYLVFLFNLISALAGLAFITVGVLMKYNFDEYAEVTSSSAPIFLMVLGAIMFVISFFGCCGAVRESSWMLTAFAIILLSLFVLQVAVGVYAFLQFRNNQTDIKTEFRSKMVSVMDRYNTDKSAKLMFDTLQQTLRCCGVDGPIDWLHRTVSIISGSVIPASCCINNMENCIIAEQYTRGCLDPLWETLQTYSNTIGIVVLSIGALEVVGAIVALCLSSSIRNQERRGYYNY